MSGINSMSRIILFLIISASDLKHQVQSTAVKEVLPGDNITLNCDIKHDGETSWFVLYPEQAPIHIFQGALKLNDNASNPTYFNGFSESRFYPLLNRTTWTVNMRIDNVSQQDFALYFCMIRVKGEMKSGNLIKLVSAHNSTSEPKTETNNAPNSTSEPKTETNNGSNCKLCCILLGCVSLLFMVVSSAFVCYFEKRGAKGARTHEEKTKATNSNPVLEQEEERDVQYASVDLKKTPKRKKKIKVLQNDVTYAAVKR